ncbi:MAG TPA: GNAT family N-acetyltransferase, partial [Nitrolancea sp.]|nr:GNAT family N-acetyltransferase [Nitrolancea sp.]
DGVPAGRLYVARWANEIRIVDIALVPRFRNRGIGTQLIGEVLAEGRESGKPVTIHVETFNPALRLYQRLGFRAKEDKGVYLLLEWSLDHQAGR